VMNSRRPTDLMIYVLPLLTGYFGDLATFYLKLQFGPLDGGHIGNGPPSGAGTLGAAATTNVLTNISIRNNALIRFIGFSPYTLVTNLRVTNVRPNYTARSQVFW